MKYPPIFGSSTDIPPFSDKAQCCVCGGEVWVCLNAVGEAICPGCFNTAANELDIPVDGKSYAQICQHAMKAIRA